MIGFKVLILVIWLAVPAVGSWLVRADYELYRSMSQLQRADCEAREDALRRYTKLLAAQAVRIESISDAGTRAAWQRQWNELVREMDGVANGLRLSEPQYYPRTDEQLLWMELWRDQQQAAIEKAARERDAYNKAGGGVLELAREIERARGIAEYYRSIGARGIYELIIADANQLEQEYRKRRRERRTLLQDVERLLTEAEQLRSNILSGLAQLDSYIETDEQRSYQLELSQRFAEFNLLGELNSLISG